MFLHGAGERGNDNRKQLVHVVPYLTSDSFQQKHPCFILAPQCPEEGYWAPVKRFEWSVIQNGEITKSMEGVLELLDNILKTSGIDKERIYMVGLSMGGFGVFDLAARRPEIFAAGVPICGGGDLQKLTLLKEHLFGFSMVVRIPLFRLKNQEKCIKQLIIQIIPLCLPNMKVKIMVFGKWQSGSQAYGNGFSAKKIN